MPFLRSAGSLALLGVCALAAPPALADIYVHVQNCLHTKETKEFVVAAVDWDGNNEDKTQKATIAYGDTATFHCNNPAGQFECDAKVHGSDDWYGVDQDKTIIFKGENDVETGSASKATCP